MVTVSKHAGFCFGVRRATDLAEQLISEGNGDRIIRTFGKLIHNEEYLKYLSENGIERIEEKDIDSLYKKALEGCDVTLMLRTHGVERHLFERLEAYHEKCPSFKVVDCACPYVKKIHKIAYENSGEGMIFILIGQEDHPEVMSIVSYCQGDYRVFADSKELENYLKTAELSGITVNMAAQTTQNLQEWKKSQELIKKYCTNAKIFDTICSVTEKRQTEATELCRGVDLMLVIGGKDSSNTSKLYSICKNHCPNTFWIQTKDDIPFDKIGNSYNIGITAGASTPDSLIQEVKKSMSEIMENFAELLAEAEAERVKIYKFLPVSCTPPKETIFILLIKFGLISKRKLNHPPLLFYFHRLKLDIL